MGSARACTYGEGKERMESGLRGIPYFIAIATFRAN